MNTFEWTLSARVNSPDTTTLTEATQTSPKEAGNEATDSAQIPATTENKNLKDLEAAKEFPASGYSYFCKTAKVQDKEMFSKFNPKDKCHYVTQQTDTVIVDLRYKFNPKTKVAGFPSGEPSRELLDAVADQVRDIVISTLNVDNKDKDYRYIQTQDIPICDS